MPGAVAAAGSIAGGAAGSALKGLLKGKEPDAQVPVIDYAPAQALMAGAIRSVSSYTNMGLGAYQSAMYEARGQIQAASATVMSQLRPLSETGTASYNEYLRLIGQDPIQKTAGYSNKLDGMGFTGDLSGVKSLLDQATNARGQDNRLRLKEAALAQLQGLKIEDNRAAEIKALGGEQQGIKLSAKPFTYVEKGSGKDGQFKKIVDKGMLASMESARREELEMRQIAYNLNMDQINTRWDKQVAEATQAKNSLIADFSSNFSAEYDEAYNADQINKKVAETPGYQVQFQQGQQAVGRIGAAAGMLGSGNTLLAAQKAGGDLATATYQTTLSNLLGSAQVGQGASDAMNSLTMQTGSMLASMDQQVGVTTANAMASEAQTAAQSLMSQASAYLQTATQNMNNLLTWRMHEQDIEAARKGSKAQTTAQIQTAAMNNQGAMDRLGVSLGAQASRGYGLLQGINQGSNRGVQKRSSAYDDM